MAASQNLILQLQQQQVLLTQQLSPTSEPINTSYKVTDPFKYTGTDQSRLNNWFFQIRLVFKSAPNKFKLDDTKIMYALS